MSDFNAAIECAILDEQLHGLRTTRERAESWGVDPGEFGDWLENRTCGSGLVDDDTDDRTLIALVDMLLAGFAVGHAYGRLSAAEVPAS